MRKKNHVIVHGPWRQSSTLTPLEFYTACQNYWRNIVILRKSLVSFRKGVAGGKIIWPTQCDCMLASLYQIDTAIQEFYRFLDKHESLSFTICTSRFAVMNALEQCSTILDDLSEDITALREYDWSSCCHSKILLGDIHSQFDELLQNWTRMHRRVTLFFNHIGLLLDEDCNFSHHAHATIVQLPSRDKYTHQVYVPDGSLSPTGLPDLPLPGAGAIMEL